MLLGPPEGLGLRPARLTSPQTRGGGSQIHAGGGRQAGGRAWAFLPTSPLQSLPWLEEQALWAWPRLSALLHGASQRPPAPPSHPWARLLRPQRHEIMSSPPRDTPKVALLVTVDWETRAGQSLGAGEAWGEQSWQSGGPNPRQRAPRPDPSTHPEAGSMAPTLLAAFGRPAWGPHTLPTLHLAPTPMSFGIIPSPVPGVLGGVGPVPGGHPVCLSTSPGLPSRGQVWGQQVHRGKGRESMGKLRGQRGTSCLCPDLCGLCCPLQGPSPWTVVTLHLDGARSC